MFHTFVLLSFIIHCLSFRKVYLDWSSCRSVDEIGSLLPFLCHFLIINSKSKVWKIFNMYSFSRQLLFCSILSCHTCFISPYSFIFLSLSYVWDVLYCILLLKSFFVCSEHPGDLWSPDVAWGWAESFTQMIQILLSSLSAGDRSEQRLTPFRPWTSCGLVVVSVALSSAPCTRARSCVSSASRATCPSAWSAPPRCTVTTAAAPPEMSSIAMGTASESWSAPACDLDWTVWRSHCRRWETSDQPWEKHCCIWAA